MTTALQELTESATQQRALLLFTLGPVQPFIEKARTVRDLTTGSYLLAWLTSKAARTVIDRSDCTLVTPDKALVRNARSPTMPNRFIVEVPAELADELAEQCRAECRRAWDELCQAVAQKIRGQIQDCVKSSPESGTPITPEAAEHLEKSIHNWDCLWADQVGAEGKPSPFDISTQVVAIDPNNAAHIRSLLGNAGREQDANWDLHYDMTWSVEAARKQTRYIHEYHAVGPLRNCGLNANFVPAKCTMFGAYEQMGPADMEASRLFWEALGDQKNGLQVDAARLRSRERLSAIGLIKRFGWFSYLRDELERERKDRGESEHHEPLNFADTATVAAAAWLRKAAAQGIKIATAAKYDADDGGKNKVPWSGQWLHWPHREFDKNERPCPEALFKEIEEARRNSNLPKVPTYYAILMLDGDFMGKLGQSLRGIEEQRKLSAVISRFAGCVQDAIEGRESDAWQSHNGNLVYAGGDDVLALLPLETALQCAAELSAMFNRIWEDDLWWKRPDVRQPSCSAGLAIVHYKHDLRFALKTARSTERVAKQCRTSKNALALTVCRRSGQHSTAVTPWDFVTQRMNGWVTQFLKSDETGSDRWTYHLARELPVLEGLDDVDAVCWEIARLVKRSKVSMTGADVVSAFREYHEFLMSEDAHPQDAAFRAKAKPAKDQDILARSISGFVTLAQSASFITRGRDE